MSKRIPEGRQTAFYLGTGIMILGIILFLSTFVSFISNFGNFSNFESNAKSGMARAFGGMILLVIGGVVRGIGARGLAGSGVVLNPSQARDDLEPYSRMTGGMFKDALDEADIDLGNSPEKIIMVKCQSCGELNNEKAKFCQECGNKFVLS